MNDDYYTDMLHRHKTKLRFATTLEELEAIGIEQRNTKHFLIRMGHWFGAMRINWLRRQGWEVVDMVDARFDAAFLGSHGRPLVWVTMVKLERPSDS